MPYRVVLPWFSGTVAGARESGARSSRAAPEQIQAEERYGYGISLHVGGRLYGVVRPYPGSLHRLASNLKIFVRSTREAEQILAHENIDSSRVIHFDLLDHEQMALC
jgi:hypothetical protein